jgi:Skp family chaperone for outer membrane proteins
MRTVRLTALGFIFAALFAVSAFAQVPATAAPAKVMFINTLAFDDAKAGIAKYSNAMTALENEFKPVETELNTMKARYGTLANEVKGIEDKLNAPTSAVPINKEELRKQYIAKGDEAANLEIQIKRKAEDGKAKFERRQTEVMQPIMQDIARAIQDFAKQKGYAVILDAAKLENAGVLLAFDETKADVTKEFIIFYNTRTPTTATTAKPQ